MKPTTWKEYAQDLKTWPIKKLKKEYRDLYAFVHDEYSSIGVRDCMLLEFMDRELERRGIDWRPTIQYTDE